MRLLKIAMLLVSIPLLAVGGERIYHVARNRQQITLTCEQFVRQPPRALWIRVTGCDVDYVNAGYRESGGRIAELFFPLRSVKEPGATPVALIAATRDPAVLEVAERTIGNGQQPTQEAYLVMMLRIITMLGISREVEGYARGGIIELGQTRRALAGMNGALAQGLVVIDLHARPSFVVSALELAAGAALLLLAVAGRRRVSRPVQQLFVPSESVLVEPAGRRLPGVMLLNLPPAAEPAAVEHAPALGNRTDVTQVITQLLGWIPFDGNGRGSLSGPDWSLALDLGTDGHVWTIVIDARGDGSIPVLATLARGTGWRMFVPRLGAFVEAADLAQVQRTG